MKKFLVLLVSFIFAFNLFADEAFLYQSSATDDLNGYSFGDNFIISSVSGYFGKDNLFIESPTDKGLPFIAKDVPENATASYDILVPYPTFLNTPNTGAGYISNAAAIKSIQIVATTNRPYDEIILMYKTTPTGPIKYIKMPQNFDTIHSMEEFTLDFNNPFYEADVNKRVIKAAPVVGAEAGGIYLVGFRIKTNMPTGKNAYSPYSIFYLKSVSVVYDKAFTDEQISANDEIKQLFGLDEYSNLREKAIKATEENNRLKAEEESKMDRSSVENSSKNSDVEISEK